MKNRGPIYLIFKDCLQINDKIMNILIGKWAKAMNQKFTKGKKKKMANDHFKMFDLT